MCGNKLECTDESLSCLLREERRLVTNRVLLAILHNLTTNLTTILLRVNFGGAETFPKYFDNALLLL